MADTDSHSYPHAREPPYLLAPLFLSGLPEPRRAEFIHAEGLEAALNELLTMARRRVSQLAAEPFLRFVAQNLSSQVTGCEELVKLRIEDLFLVYGYGSEDPVASEVIESQYLPQIEHALRSYDLSDFDRADILQMLRHRLWASHVPQQGVAPYSGRGELLGWLRVTALREAGHLVQRGQGNAAVSELDGLEIGQVAESPELQLLKAQYREEFRRAFDAAMAALSDKDQVLLRYVYLDNLEIDKIAKIYKVNRSTVVRWLSQARGDLLKQTKKNLQQQHALAGINLDELLKLIWSQLDVSIRHHLLARPG